jgi:hypothetical protein
MSASLRLPEPPQTQFVKPTFESIIAHLRAVEDWQRKLVQATQDALDVIATQAATGYTVANPTINRTLDSTADAAATVRNQLGTLVLDLRNKGVIG